MLEGRYVVGRSLLFMVGGLAMVGVNTALYFFAPYHYPALWAVGGVLAVLGRHVVDRRVKLRIGPEGLFYASWTSQAIPWGEFESFRVFQVQKYRFIEAHTKYPEQLRQRLGALQRFNAWLNQRFGRPPFFINFTQLDVTVDDVVAALKANGAPAT